MDINRVTAYHILAAIEIKKQYSNIAVNNYIEKDKPDSKGFVRELVYGVLENQIYLDYLISFLIKGKLKDIRRQDLIILRMGIYQIKFMNSVPDYAAVDQCVRLARKFARGREKFINGVLRGYLRRGGSIKLPDRKENIVNFLSVKYSYAAWIVKLWLEYYDEEFVEKLLAAGNERPPLTIRVNTTKISRDKLIEKLEKEGFKIDLSDMTSTGLKVRGEGLLDTEAYFKGEFSVQDEASQLSIQYLEPKKWDVVLDLCAAPGGKSLASAEKMENTGLVISQDFYNNKVEGIIREAERLGLKNIRANIGDATVANVEFIESADRVIVDVPCSGLGVIRRKPEIKFRKNEDEIMALPQKQLIILENAQKYLKNGGKLLYSTCTVNRRENEDIVNKFREVHDNFIIEKEIQLLPHVHGTDGFYICVMRKEGENKR